ncbi:hypothetical protein ATN84_17270 [Paramesorhizobium deserti]|uniref:OmpA-like domain-containing protein n=1 Tax=Paramesorhizobium deserti TaxID=1494590 RepID=A0A135HR94_9HYPH|nr:hypothetical protein ATN84_17270 [Paramesorhizobium deserti]
MALDKPSLNFSGRDGTLSANAFSFRDISEAATAVGHTAGVRLVKNEAKLVPTVQPYNFGIEKTGNTITLTGNVPRPDIRQSILDSFKAENPSANVVDKLTYALGAPAGFENAAKFAAKQLSDLSTASMTLSNGTLSVNGIAQDRTNLANLMTALKSPPQDVALGQVNVQGNSPDSTVKTASVQPSDDTVFSAVRNGQEKTLTLGGNYQNDQQHQEILAAAKRNFASHTVIDNMTKAENAPTDILAAATLALPHLSRLSDGALHINNKTVNLSGSALHENAAQAIKSAITGPLPNGYTGQADIAIAKPGAPIDNAGCQSLFSEITHNDTIHFETGSARIDKDSARVLDSVVATAQRCPSGKVEIQGYTDSEGSPKANLALSQQRSNAVRQYMVNAGVDGSRLTAVGYGQAKPIASNDTQSGRAKNRRIEFLVK